MEFLRRYLSTIRAQLAGLTISQKLLIGLLIVVMVATIFFTVALSAKPEMVVLIPQSMSPEQINQVEMYLKGKYEYQAQADKIMVPADKAYEIRGELFAAQALPKDTTAAFAALIRDSSFLKTDSVTSKEWTYATSETLTKMLRFFPGLDDAAVVIAKGERAGLGRDPVPSSASVQVKVRGGEGLTSNQVVAIVDMVRGAVAGLKREDVHVTDGVRVYHAPGSDQSMPSDLLEYKKSIEDDLVRKLYTMFGDVGNVKIAVNVVPDMSVHSVEEEKFDPKVVKATRSETSQEEQSNEGSGAGTEPGVKPNVGAVADSGGGGGRRSTTSKANTSVQNDNFVNRTLDKAMLPAGTQIKDLTASISLPRSYFVAIFRRVNKDQKAEPDDDNPDFMKVINKQIENARLRAQNAIGAKDSKQVVVDWFDDTIVSKPIEFAGGLASTSGSMPAMVSQYAKQTILAAVAIGVLGMMLMMVRKAVPSAGGGGEIDPSVFFGGGGGVGTKGKRKAGDPQALDVSDDVFGEAGEGDAVLTGIELDDDTLQSRKMVDEVSNMIKENPENAAALVKKWMTKGK